VGGGESSLPKNALDPSLSQCQPRALKSVPTRVKLTNYFMARGIGGFVEAGARWKVVSRNLCRRGSQKPGGPEPYLITPELIYDLRSRRRGLQPWGIGVKWPVRTSTATRHRISKELVERRWTAAGGDLQRSQFLRSSGHCEVSTAGATASGLMEYSWSWSFFTRAISTSAIIRCCCGACLLRDFGGRQSWGGHAERASSKKVSQYFFFSSLPNFRWSTSHTAFPGKPHSGSKVTLRTAHLRLPGLAL